MAKKQKTLTRGQILSVPDAPKGQRFCDDVEAENKAFESMANRISQIEHLLKNNAGTFLEIFQQQRDELYKVAEELTGEKRADILTRALAVLKATGLTVCEFKNLPCTEELDYLKAAAKLKRHEQARLLAAMQELLDLAGKKAKPKAQKSDKKRKPMPSKVMMDARERLIAKLLAENGSLTAEQLAKKLEVDKSTIVRTAAWQKKGVLSHKVRSGIITKKKDDSFDIDAID